jgi:predicted nucleotidyltransferase component of viral defense system
LVKNQKSPRSCSQASARIQIMGQSILTSEQRLILDKVISTPEITDAFYLTGGTALSEFYFQHRLSEDFDFFSETPFEDKEILDWVGKTARELKVNEVEYKTLRGQLTFFLHFSTSVVKIDFAFYPFPHLGEFSKHQSLRVASILDIGVNKIQAIQTRKRGRDFFDLYFILTQGGLSIEQLLQEYRNKFNIVLSAQELSKHFMGVLEAIDQPRFLGKVDWSEIEKFFSEKANNLADEFVE